MIQFGLHFSLEYVVERASFETVRVFDFRYVQEGRQQIERRDHVIRIMGSGLDLSGPTDHPRRTGAVVIQARLGEGKRHAVVG